MEVLTRLNEERRLGGGDKYKNPSTRGLIVPPYNRGFIVVSRMDREGFRGPIANVFYVREAITKEPLVLKPSEESVLPFSNEVLDNFHEEMTAKGFDWGYCGHPLSDDPKDKTLRSVDSVIGYRMSDSIGQVEIGIDP